VKVTVETACLPLAVAKDVVTMGSYAVVYEEPSFTRKQLEKIKKASEG